MNKLLPFIVAGVIISGVFITPFLFNSDEGSDDSVVAAVDVKSCEKWIKPQRDWWNTSFNYRKTITVNKSMIDGDTSLINFPLLINVTDSNFSHAQSDGDDFKFVSLAFDANASFAKFNTSNKNVYPSGLFYNYENKSQSFYCYDYGVIKNASILVRNNDGYINLSIRNVNDSGFPQGLPLVYCNKTMDNGFPTVNHWVTFEFNEGLQVDKGDRYCLFAHGRDTSFPFSSAWYLEDTPLPGTNEDYPEGDAFYYESLVSGWIKISDRDFCFNISGNITGTLEELNHEIENFSDNHLIAWVNVTSLNPSYDKILHLYYGNPDCSNQENVEDTWHSKYSSVVHFKDKYYSDPYWWTSDSTSNDNNMVIASGAGWYKDHIGYAYGCNGSYVAIAADSDSLDVGTSPFVLQMNVDIHNDVALATPFHKWDAVNKLGWATITETVQDPTVDFYIYHRGAITYVDSSGLNYFEGNFWRPYDIVVGRTIGDGGWFRDGEEYKSGLNVGSINLNNDAYLYLGWLNPYNHLDATIDEFRLYKGSLTDEWIKTEYNNQFNYSTYVIDGEEEVMGHFFCHTHSISHSETPPLTV